MKAGLFKHCTALMLALFMLVMLGACMTERTPIDKTNPLALDKRLFEGEWFFKQTVVDKPYRFDVSFMGETNEVKILRWEVTEHWLIGYDIHDHFEAVGIDGVMDQGKPPVVAYPILSHFDMKLAENPTNGEDMPMMVENRDNPWWQRRYFVIDPSSSAVSVYQLKYMNMTIEWTNPFHVEPIAGYFNLEFYDKTGDVINPRDYEKRYLAGGENLVNVFSFENESVFTANNSWRRIYTWEDIHEFINYEPMRVSFRNYFWRVDREDDLIADFEPMEMQDNMFRRFGYFTRDYFGVDPQHGRRENYYHKWANKYNTETVTKTVVNDQDQEEEITINHKIDVYLSPDYPERLLLPACSTAVDYNHAFSWADWAKHNPGKEDTFPYEHRQKRLQSFWLSGLSATPEEFDKNLDPWPADMKLPLDEFYYIDYMEDDPEKVQAYLDYCFPGEEASKDRKYSLHKNYFLNYDYDRDGVNPEGMPNMITMEELYDIYGEDYINNMIDPEHMPTGPVACRLSREHRCAVDAEGKKIARWFVELGDGQHSLYYFVNKASVYNPLGVSQWSDNPETGQIFSSVAHVFGTDMQAWISREMERYEVIRGLKDSAFDPSASRWEQIINETIIDAEHTKVPSQSEVDDFPDQEPNPVPPLPGTPKYRMSAAYNTQLAMGLEDDDSEFGLAPGRDDLSESDPMGDTERLEALRPPEYQNNWDINQLAGSKWENLMGTQAFLDYVYPDDTEYDEEMLYMISPIYWGSPQKLAELAEREIEFSTYGGTLSEWLDGGFLALMNKMEDDLGYSKEQIRRAIEKIAFKGTLEHEAGHCVGLRHNFRGSMDEANYVGLNRGPKKAGYFSFIDDYNEAMQQKIEEFRADNGRDPDAWEKHYIDSKLAHVKNWYGYASIMDYHDNFYYTSQGFGQYDYAAMKFAYGFVVEKYKTENGQIVMNGDGYPTIVNEPLFAERACTSSDIYNTDCACTPGMMLQSDIDAGYECVCTDTFGQEYCFLDGKKTVALRLEPKVEMQEDEDGNMTPVNVGGMSEIQLNGDIVPYQFCTDHQVYEDPMCNRWDHGTTARDIVRNAIDQYNMYYYWRMMRRGNPMFRRASWWRSVMRMFTFAHFALDLNYNRFQIKSWQNMLLDRATDPFVDGVTPERKDYLLALNGVEEYVEDGEAKALVPGGPGDYLIAGMEGYNFLVYDIVYRPNVGKHVLSSWLDNSSVQYFEKNPYIYSDEDLADTIGGAMVDVDLRFGRYHKNHWNRQDDIEAPTEKLEIRGFTQEKNAASFVLYNSGWWVSKYQYESMANAFSYLSDGFENVGYDMMADTINEDSMFNFTPYCVHQKSADEFEVKRFRPRVNHLFLWNYTEDMSSIEGACASDDDCSEGSECWLKEDGNFLIEDDDETTLGLCKPKWTPAPSDPNQNLCERLSEQTGDIYIPLHASWVYFDKMTPSFWAMLNQSNTMADQTTYWYYNTHVIPAHEYAAWTTEDSEEYNVNVVECLNEKENLYYRAYKVRGDDHLSPIYELVKRCKNIRGVCLKEIGKGHVPGNYYVGEEICSNGYPAYYVNRKVTYMETTMIMLNEFTRFWTGIGTTAYYPMGSGY